MNRTVEMCFIITFEIPGADRRRSHRTHSGTYTVPSGMTRHEVFRRIRDDHDPAMRKLSPNVILSEEERDRRRWAVVFFSLEPNRIV